MGSLIRLQQGAVQPPVYCFHPFGGSAAVYGLLALHIGADRLVYGLQSAGLAAGCPPDPTVPDMARRYAAEVLGTAPAGRAVFLGYSMGGVLALETARLVRDTWTEPPHVVLVDCDPLYATRPGEGPWHILLHQVLDIALPVDRLTGLPFERALELVRAAGARQGRIPARFSLDRLGRLLSVCQVNERAAAGHIPAPFPGTVHVIRTAPDGPEPDGSAPDTDSWTGFADEVVVSAVPVDHHAVIGPDGCPAIAARVHALLTTEEEACRPTTWPISRGS